MNRATLLACRDAVQRAHDTTPSRSSTDEYQRKLLKAAADVLGSLGTLTTEQLDWLTKPEAQAAVKAAYKAAKENL